MLAIKKTLSYITITSLLLSNITLAGEDILPEGQDWEHPLTTIRPNTFSSTREIDALHIYESGEIVAEDLEGNQSSIKPYNQPQEIRDAIQHGQLSSLLNHFNLYVTKPGEELKIQLMGGLKGGGNGPSKGGGGSRYTPYQPILSGPSRYPEDTGGKYNTVTGEVIERPRITITPLYTSNYRPPQEIGVGKPFTKPNRQTTQGPSLTSRPHTHITDRDPKKISTSGNTLEEQKKQQDIKIAHTQMTTALTDVITKYPQSLLSNMSKSGVSKEFFPMWQSNKGKQFGTLSHMTYGYNIENNAAVVSKQNGLSYPIFIDDRKAQQTACFLPEGYKTTYSQDKGMGDFIIQRYGDNTLVLMDHIIGVPNDKHNPVRAVFYKNHNELNVRLTLGHGSDKSYQTLFIRTTYPELLNANETQKQQLGRILRDLDGVLYNSRNPQPGRFGAFISRSDVPPHMLSNIEAMKSFIGRNENGTINSSALALRPAVRNINGHIGMEDPYLKNGLVYSLFKEDRVQDGAYLPQGYKQNPEHERLGEALLRGYGRAVDQLLCETIGFCDANANPIRLALEIGRNPTVVDWSAQGVRWLASTIGLSASTMWNGKVKNFVTDAVDWVKPHILRTSIEELVIDIAIMQRWGEDAPKILSTPAELEKAIKIEMGQYDGKVINILKQDYIGAPKTLPAFPEATRAREKTYVKGAGLRKRWRDKDHIYEWDSRHGKVEKYTSQGKHLGEFDPNTGEQTKPADPSRRVEK